MEKMKDVSEGKTVLFAERDIQTVVGGGSLQFEIERAAKTFAESESPGFVNAATKGGVDYELHAAAFVEEALGDYCCLRGNSSEQRATSHDVLDGLLGAGVV